MRMRERSDIIVEYGTYMLAYLSSYVASLAELYYLSGGILIIEALGLYIHWFRQSWNFVELRALFTLAWVGGQGIACLQLSMLQKKWTPVTWLCFFLIYIGFGIGYEWKRDYKKEERNLLIKNDEYSKKMIQCIAILTIISIICFFIEVKESGFIPIFSEDPFAYSYFHIPGLSYLTISCILVPAITVLYMKICKHSGVKQKVLLICSNLVAIAIPTFCAAGFQLLFAIGISMVIYTVIDSKVRVRMVFCFLAILAAAYILLTIIRDPDVTYLNNIFEMKYEKMPIFITQPYVYVANNFENFNCLAEQLSKHTFGIRMLYPIFTFTGLKLAFPQVVSAPVFLTRPELKTLTMFYDAYYDFGVLGILAFAITLGVLARIISKNVKRNKNPIAYMFYAQIAVYLGLAFFTTWFSNPTTWFWMILTSIMYWYIGHSKEKSRRDGS